MRAPLALSLALLLCLVPAASQCTMATGADLLQAGSTLVYNSYGGASVREHYYQFAVGFSGSTALQIAACNPPPTQLPRSSR